MTLDTEQQRALLLELIRTATFPGAALDVVFELRESIVHADVKDDKAGVSDG